MLQVKNYPWGIFNKVRPPRYCFADGGGYLIVTRSPEVSISGKVAFVGTGETGAPWFRSGLLPCTVL
jgi:hypothetical protein